MKKDKKEKPVKKSARTAEEPKEVKEVKAVARYIRTAPRKLRLVMDGIRGLPVEKALTILKFTPKRAAKTLAKVLKSAVANAENNFHLDAESLFVHGAFVDGGPVMKRWIPRAMGRASQVLKKTSHITFIVKQREGVS